jgi:peptidoglycan-associated lipoprotein
MKYTVRIIWPLVLVMILLCGTADAQHKEMKQALADFSDLQYFKAAENYQKALDKIEDDQLMKDHATFMLGECYRMMNDPDRAEIYYHQLAGGYYGEGKPEYYLRYADVLRMQGKTDEARGFYRKYLKATPRDHMGKAGLASCDWIESNKNRRIQVNVFPAPTINSSYDDFAPAFFSSHFDKMVFTSNRSGTTGKHSDQWYGLPFSDLFVTSLSASGWAPPVLLDQTEMINTEVHEGTAAFNGDFTAIYFTRCNRSDAKMQYCRILKSTRTGDGWTEPEVVFADTAANMGQPTVSKDELTIFFSSDMKGGEGGKDIWTARRASREEPFGKPVQPGRGINTPGNEMFPYLCNDTLLFYSSDGLPGYGGLDIYRSVFRNNSWSAPENLLRPINSGYDDFGIIFKVPGEEGYFTSNRTGGIGGDDIYGFTRRTMLFNASGQVRDQMTLLPLPDAQVLLISEKGDSVSMFTDQQGRFRFDTTYVKEYSDYILFIRKDNYFAQKEEFTSRIYQDDHHFRFDYLLEPIPDQPIVLPDILYALDDWRLQPQYEDSLMQLVELLQINETLVIELRSHTDSRASHEYNDVLSQKRAQSVVDFLISQGIDPGRLVAKGYGERVFRVLNKDVVKENYHFKAGTELNDQFVYSLPTKDIQEAAFQLNRRTEFFVLAKDYKPSTGTPSQARGPVIQIISDTSSVNIDFTYTADSQIMTTFYLNDYGVEAVFSPDSPETLIDEEIVLDLLKKGAINRNDFDGDFEEIMTDGRIAENATLVFKKARLGGQIVLDNTVVKVIAGTGKRVLVGQDLLGRMGSYTIDENASQLIFK